MKFAHTARRPLVIAAALALALGALPAGAQDIGDSHLKAAREAIAALHATDGFDLVLPQAAQALKQQLIQKDPNLQADIIDIVDSRTLALVPRRADLEKEAATAYAKVFSEQELKDMAAFYSSPSGKKLLSDGPIVSREVGQAAEIWQRGVARDLAQAVAEEMQKRFGTSPTEEPEKPAAPQTQQ